METVLSEHEPKVSITLPAGIEMSAATGRPGRYHAVQQGTAEDYDGDAWFDLCSQMMDASYMRTASARWHEGAWHCRFKPAPYRTSVVRKLRPALRWFFDWTIPPKGSPREIAPRFDGEFFGNWIRRLTALGVFSTIFAILVQTRVKLEELRAIDLATWTAEQGAQRLLSLLTIAEGLVMCLLFAITVDLAYYTSRRLYRVTG